jgi:hypothetical protein
MTFGSLVKLEGEAKAGFGLDDKTEACALGTKTGADEFQTVFWDLILDFET